jgi:formylglycine-generating enzyme required for sulfatase activity
VGPPSGAAPRNNVPSTNGAAEGLIGQLIGAYQIVSHLGEGRLGSAYAAVQISINRPVGLKVLDSEHAQDEASKARFIADARAKAHVQHPSIVAVYEAGESEGRIFYAREYVDGQSMADVAAGGRPLEEYNAVKVMRVVAEGFIYLHLNNIPHQPLEATKVFLGMDGHPRLANLAVQVADEHLSTEQEIQTLGQIMFSVVPGAQILSSQMSVLLSRMVQAQTSGLNSWGAVLQAVKALEPKNVPVEAMKISAQDKAAIEAVEAARRQQRRSLWINVASLTALFALVVFLALRKFVFTNERQIQAMVKIPSGSYQLPSGKTVQIERDYWIDKYEVTWGQYARFLDFLNKNPTADQDFRHPKMPRYLEHESEDLRRYMNLARAGKPAHSVPIDLNCPAMTLTWWDAYAYAKWLGSQTGTERDLPTEEEWEIAASGEKGFKYPWGNEFDPKKANTNADHKPATPGEKGIVDGYNYWSSVDSLTSDKSFFGVIGLGGNVAEWTGSWTEDNRFPIIKGGSYNFGATSNDKRISNHDPNKSENWIGFRTISRTKPSDAE